MPGLLIHFIFTTVFHRILDKKNGLDLYPGPFFHLFPTEIHASQELFFTKCILNYTSLGRGKKFIRENSLNSTNMENESKKEIRDNTELEKSQSHIIIEILEYMTNSVVIKTIIKKATGSISIMSFDSGEGLSEKTSPFDSFAQIVEGSAEIVIDKIPHTLLSGQGIVIPAHASNLIQGNGRFKMILTIIKSGYE